MIVRSVCVVALLAGASAADAAMIELMHPAAGRPLIVVTGDFEPTDIDTFRKIAAPLTNAMVSFASDGGTLVTGIQIGRVIRQKKFSTIVPDGSTCASACAVAWLGGVKRFVSREASVGFHAVYVVKPGGATESGPGNAILGAYLNQLGLSEDAIRYVTFAEPANIHWMTTDEAAEHGISVSLAGAPQSAAPPTTGSKAATNAPRDYPDGSPERRAVDFVQSLVARWEGPRDEAALGDLYTNVVLYQGKPVPRDTVIARKRRVAELWSERSYAIRSPSLSAVCTEGGGVCQVKGVMDWQLRNARNRASARGATSFDYSLVLHGAAPQIAAESSTHIGKPAPAPTALAQVGRDLQQFFAKISKLAPLPRKSTNRPGAAIAR